MTTTDQPRFRIRQNGMTVASSEGPNAEAMIWGYAFKYRPEGDLTIQFDAYGHWKRFAFLAKWDGDRP